MIISFFPSCSYHMHFLCIVSRLKIRSQEVERFRLIGGDLHGSWLMPILRQ